MVSSHLHKAWSSISYTMSVTGYRNVQRLRHHIKPTDQVRKQFSSHLSHGNSNVNEVVKLASSHLVNFASSSSLACQNNNSDIQVAVTCVNVNFQSHM